MVAVPESWRVGVVDGLILIVDEVLENVVSRMFLVVDDAAEVVNCEGKDR